MTAKRHPSGRRLLAAATLLAIIQAAGAPVASAVETLRSDPGAADATRPAPSSHLVAPPAIGDGAPGPMTLGRALAFQREVAFQRELASAQSETAPAPTPAPTPPAGKPALTTTKPAAAKPAAVALRLQMPDLGISQVTRSYPCDRATPPANYVYRWGCAGANNLYLLGHAYSVFKPLHDAYAAGRLRVGMVAYWTNSRGHTTTYRVTGWRLLKPDNPNWAIASQPVPSMTLQTCYGADSEYRLVVRLVAD